MIEIKFRAWDESNKRMLTNECVDLLIDLQGRLNSHNLGDLNGYDNTPQYPLMQYTGLKDRNGEEIYEGDIIQGKNRIFDNQVIAQKVSFLNGCFMFGNWNAHEYFNKHTEIEAIGNIYENKELLEK